MKIEILICEDINEKCTNMTCFEAEPVICKAISRCPSFRGVVIIDKQTVKFNFSCMGMDGDIFTNDSNLRFLVRRLIPMYAYQRYVEGRLGIQGIS